MAPEFPARSSPFSFDAVESTQQPALSFLAPPFAHRLSGVSSWRILPVNSVTAVPACAPKMPRWSALAARALQLPPAALALWSCAVCMLSM